MEELEHSPNPELALPHVDALIVLGRNFQPGFNRKTLAEQRFHLSPGSRINTLAAGLICKAGLADTLIISTGHTAGSNVPSEAKAMKDDLQRIFKDIPDEAIILEETSVDTEGNANEVKKIIDRHPEFKTFGLLADTSHLERTPLFERVGIQVVPFDALAILGEKRPKLIENYIKSEIYQKTEKQDKRARQIQSLPIISPLTSWLLHKVALRMRNPNKPNPYISKTSGQK
ncbi:MAG: YdcF family protein [Candidatus Levyibacteriota bacterium]